MNVQNLTKGQVIKNYKELCRVLEIKALDGNSKAAQIKELERFAKIERRGHSFTIIEIYQQAMEKVVVGSRTLYVDNFSIQLLHALFRDYTYKAKKGLAEEGSNYMFGTPNQLSQLTGMVNNEYRFTKFAIKDFIENKEYALSKFDVDEFFKATTNKINSTIKTSLKILEGRKIIVPYKRHLFSLDGKQYVTDDAQETAVADVQNKVYRSMGFQGMSRKGRFGEPLPVGILSEIYLSHRGDEFYETFNREMLERYGWRDIFSGWKINFHTSRLEENIAIYQREYDVLLENKMSMNEKFVSYLGRSSQKRYDENQAKYENFVNQIMGEVEKKEYPFKYEEDYVRSQALLTELFVRIK